jgi:hypothetical protein
MGAASAAGAFSPGAPAQGNYGAETAQALQAQIQEAPQLYQAQANPSYGEPAYAALNLTNLSTLLNGANGQAGLLADQQQAQAAAAKGQSAANTILRTSSLNDVLNLGPTGVAAMNAADPAGASLLTQLNTQANQGLAAGSGMTADQQRQLNNSVSGSQGARGMAYGPASAYASVLATSQAGQQQLAQRQQTAAGVVGADQSFYGAPYQAILGTQSNAGGAANSLLAQGNAMQPGSQFNPQSPLAASIYSQNLTSTNTYNAANAGGQALQQGVGGAYSGLLNMFNSNYNSPSGYSSSFASGGYTSQGLPLNSY